MGMTGVPTARLLGDLAVREVVMKVDADLPDATPSKAARRASGPATCTMSFLSGRPAVRCLTRAIRAIHS
ncbi:MAG: hypothetical protein ABIX46_06450 [Burkholderiaceae bacterium]